jgi:hypothetical protein
VTVAVRPSGPRPLTAAQQYLFVRTNPICAGTGRLSRGSFVWRYAATPTSLSRVYSVRLCYRQGTTPRVVVDGPDLAGLAGDRRLPHVYRQRPPELCLYFPQWGEWKAWMRLDQTIVPWTFLWLFYFEEWLASNDWKGGGIHPPADAGHRRRRGGWGSLRDGPAMAGDGEEDLNV